MFKITRRVWLLAFLLAVTFGNVPWIQGMPLADMTAKEVLTEADEARGNLDGVQWELHLETEDQTGKQEMTLEVQARGFDVVTTTLAPSRSKGNRLLMFKDNMWFYKPGLSKPVPISKRQKMMGSAAYGDVATTNYADDYEATLIGEELIDGVTCLVYDLRAIHNKVTYDRIKYWIDKERLVGIKAEYFTVSGQHFKSARMEYGNRVRRDGELKPFISRIEIQGKLLRSENTVLSFSDPILRKIPDYAFNLDLIAQ